LKLPRSRKPTKRKRDDRSEMIDQPSRRPAQSKRSPRACGGRDSGPFQERAQENALDICARLSTRCRGVYWCRVPLAWGLPKYQSHTRLQIIYVYIARMRARARASVQHDITRRRRSNSSSTFEILLVGRACFFSAMKCRIYFSFTQREREREREKLLSLSLSLSLFRPGCSNIISPHAMLYLARLAGILITCNCWLRKAVRDKSAIISVSS